MAPLPEEGPSALLKGEEVKLELLEEGSSIGCVTIADDIPMEDVYHLEIDGT